MLRDVPANNVRALLDYMHERQRVYLKRKARKPFAWTDDPVLRRYRLENVYREQDKETVWFATNWRKPYSEHANLWFAACLFRMVMVPSPRGAWLDTFRRSGQRVFVN